MYPSHEIVHCWLACEMCEECNICNTRVTVLYPGTGIMAVGQNIGNVLPCSIRVTAYDMCSIKCRQAELKKSHLCLAHCYRS